jgi:hypothetical protein
MSKYTGGAKVQNLRTLWLRKPLLLASSIAFGAGRHWENFHAIPRQFSLKPSVFCTIRTFTRGLRNSAENPAWAFGVLHLAKAQAV